MQLFNELSGGYLDLGTSSTARLTIDPNGSTTVTSASTNDALIVNATASSGRIRLIGVGDTYLTVQNTASTYQLIGAYPGWDTGAIYVGGYNSLNQAGIASNKVIFGTGSGGAYLPTYGASFNVSSDIRWKKDITLIPDSLEKILQLNGYTYHWKNKPTVTKKDLGVIAQEVEKQFPEAVNTDNNGYKTVNYPGLVAPVINAIKEMYTRFSKGLANHEDRLMKLENKLTALEQQNELLKKQNEELLGYIKSQNEKAQRIPASADK